MGPDETHPLVFKILALELSEPLCIIFNNSILSGKVPCLWKLANATPLHKSGSKLVSSNYLQLSLTSILCKVMEHFINQHMMSHLIEQKIISSDQHGFFRGRSTVTNLLEFMDLVTCALDNGFGVDVAFLDFAKAFDRVPFQRLILKLSNYGFRGQLLQWLTDYLIGRKQRLVLGDYVGSWRDVSSGVPQGSVIGPLLFIIYVNDLFKMLSVNVKGFADDLQLISINNSENQRQIFQESFDSIFEWTQKWQFLNILISTNVK
jgi:hypothetical protein